MHKHTRINACKHLQCAGCLSCRMDSLHLPAGNVCFAFFWLFFFLFQGFFSVMVRLQIILVFSVTITVFIHQASSRPPPISSFFSFMVLCELCKCFCIFFSIFLSFYRLIMCTRYLKIFKINADSFFFFMWGHQETSARWYSWYGHYLHMTFFMLAPLS